MRTGAEYRAALRDGRRVWVLGEGANALVPFRAGETLRWRLVD